VEARSTGAKLNKRLQWTDGSTTKTSLVSALSTVIADTIQRSTEKMPVKLHTTEAIAAIAAAVDRPSSPGGDALLTVLLVGSTHTDPMMTAIASKLAWKLQEPSKLSSTIKRKVMMLPRDAAAVSQVQALLSKNAKQLSNVALYTNANNKDKVMTTAELSAQAIQDATNDKFDVVVIDSTGMDAAEIKKTVGPVEVFAVVDLTKDNIESVVTEYQKELAVSGLVLTVLDGSSGDTLLNSLLKIPSYTSVPVKYLIHGEKVTDIYGFQAGQVVDALLGNDISDVALTEQDIKDLEELREFGKMPGFMRKNRRKDVDFTYDDYRDQVTELVSLGGIEKVVNSFQGNGCVRSYLGDI
jgi:signal recognition particle GTPase